MNAIESIYQRRSVYPKQYSGEIIPKEKIEKILECANLAPTHARNEPWRFKVFTGNGLVSLGQKQADLYKQITANEAFNEERYEKLKNAPSGASHIIAICVQLDTSGKIPEIEEICATACAVQNMALAAVELGVGGYWSTGGFTFRPEMKEILGLTETQKCLGFFYLGVPKGELPKAIRKSDINTKVEWIVE